MDERLQVLKMIETGKINADEGAKLLEAMDAGAPAAPPAPGRAAKWIRVRVYDLRTGRTKVSANIPMGLVHVALRFVPPEVLRREGMDIDPAEIIRAIQEGAEGKLVEVVDEDDGVKVEVFVE